jgi:FRG domain
MQELHARSWSEFNHYIAARDGWAFRGERDAGWPLLGSLPRQLQQSMVPRELWDEREARAIRIFRRKAHVYLPDRTVLADDLRCLAMMQHHGAPTRLLDFTKSPYVAAFFALERALSAAAVYALNTPKLRELAPRFDKSLTPDHVDPRVEGNFERYFALNKHPLVWFGEPREMDRRLVAQSGLLVLPGMLDLPLDELLGGYDSDQPLIEKVVLGHELRGAAMHALYRMNITQATLFPDLEGLARSIAYELEEAWPLGTVERTPVKE